MLRERSILINTIVVYIILISNVIYNNGHNDSAFTTKS